MKRKSFSELPVKAQSDPGRRARIEAFGRAIADVQSLADIRTGRGLTQRDVAQAMNVSQANVSRVEHQEDLYLSTLRGYISALGGNLELTAVFPERRITFTPNPS
ncbi:MAG TPA: XRE family transcriptional regulator [Thermomicrobiales bacterium]|nr:XRE family transcriptional regulator [Thermomicrobiales bacterium]